MNKIEIPIFFSVDDNYIPFLVVALRSLKDNASKNYNYKIIVLNSGLSNDNINVIKKMSSPSIKIEFADVNEKINEIAEGLSLRLRDYYSNAIYYRIFIASLFPQYDKALYLDADITLIDDVSKLFFEDIGANMLGVVPDGVVNGNDLLERYSTDALGVDKGNYFNSGVLVMNLDKMREYKIEEKFVHLLSKYNFDTIAPDQDYLNVLCKNKVKYLNKGWDRMPIAIDDFDEKEIKLVHYNMFEKPWHYYGVRYEKYFWKYAKKTKFYKQLLDMREKYTDEQAKNDRLALDKMLEQADRIINSEITFKKIVVPTYFDDFVNAEDYIVKNEERLKVIENIKKAIESGNYNHKVEIGDPTITDEQRQKMIINFDSLRRRLPKRMNAWASRKVADLATEMVNKTTEIFGLENIEGIDSGAIITCNHFSVFDNTVIRHLMRKIGKEKKLYIVVQETNMLMRGFIGWLMKNCYTIPLSLNTEYIAKNFNPTIKKILDKNGFILIYPEEEMWFNYKRPRNHKIGAYHYACKFDVPVIPCFIEMKETKEVGKDGFYKVDYRLHVLEPIYPNLSLSMRERKEDMRKKDYDAKVKAYEEIYGRSISEEFNVKEDIAGW